MVPSSSMIGVVDVGLGNATSVHRMISKIGGRSLSVTSPTDLRKIDKLILPGVGHFGEGVRRLKQYNLDDEILEMAVHQKKDLMGICLGMQLLCATSEEGNLEGLGLIDANVVKFCSTKQRKIKVPHMGWNLVNSTKFNPLLSHTEEKQRFYFVHSYKVVPKNSSVIIGTCNYGGEFCAAYQQENIFGVQFHPEKSHRFGMALMKVSASYNLC